MKRFLTLLLSVLVLLTAIPATSVVAFANEIDDVISAAKTELNSSESTTTNEQVNFETINIEAGRPQYFASSNNEIVLPQATQITRAEWLHNLVVVFEMTVESESLPDNYFTDLESTHKYYEDILLAVEFFLGLTLLIMSSILTGWSFFAAVTAVWAPLIVWQLVKLKKAKVDKDKRKAKILMALIMLLPTVATFGGIFWIGHKYF